MKNFLVPSPWRFCWALLVLRCLCRHRSSRQASSIRSRVPRGQHAKAAQAKLEQEFSRRDKELNDLGATLKSATRSSNVMRPRCLKASAWRANASWWTRTAIFSASAVNSGRPEFARRTKNSTR